MNFQIKSLKPGLMLPFLLGTVLLPGGILQPQSIQAHETQVEGGLAAIWHIEPNDAPVAGQPAQVRVALTRAGGKIIPLADCDCTLTIWSVPEGDEPLLQPTLKPISAEQYIGIPAADVVFPNRGHYKLELQGTPKVGVDFEPFSFSNEILVATGTDMQAAALPAQSPAVAPLSAPLEVATTPEDLARDSIFPWRILGLGLAIAIVTGLGIWVWKKDQD